MSDSGSPTAGERAARSSIPLDLEIIVSIAYRFRKAQLSEPRGFIEKYSVRSPDEMEHAVAEVEAAMWAGTLRSVHDMSSATRPHSDPAFDHSKERRPVWVAGLGPCICSHCASLRSSPSGSVTDGK